MLRLLSRLFAALIGLLCFSVFAAWAWDSSDRNSPAAGDRPHGTAMVSAADKATAGH